MGGFAERQNMFPNKVKQAWAEGRPVINGWLGIGNPFVAEIMAAAGFDSLTIDAQHGFLDYSDACAMLQAMRASARQEYDDHYNAERNYELLMEIYEAAAANRRR